MSDLDEKLLEAVYQGVSLNKLDKVPENSINWFKASPNGDVFEFVIEPETITQAFIDAGWFRPNDERSIQDILNENARLKSDKLKDVAAGNMKSAYNPSLQRIKDDARRGGLDDSFIFKIADLVEHDKLDDALEFIEQAFKDLGWIPPSDKSVYEQAKADAYMKARFKPGEVVTEEEYERRMKAHPMYAIQRGISDSFYFTGDMDALKEANGFMTGEEWYDRFERYLPDTNTDCAADHVGAGDSCDPIDHAERNGRFFMRAEALEAAKKASGVE